MPVELTKKELAKLRGQLAEIGLAPDELDGVYDQVVAVLVKFNFAIGADPNEGLVPKKTPESEKKED